jgi:NADH-quinone oxidoreductase subunit H
LALFSWSVIPFCDNLVIADINFSIFFIFSMSTLGVYSIIMSGWSSNSKYAFLGGLRSSAQLISYEIFMLISILPILMDANSLNLILIVHNQGFCWNVFFFFPSFLLCFVAILAETNRVPFDLPEAESELVSGYMLNILLLGLFFFF